jgi:hypothetical protein
MVLGIFKHAGRTDGKGITCGGQIRPQGICYGFWHLAVEKGLGNGRIRRLRPRQVAQLIGLDKGIKTGTGDHQGVGNGEVDPWKKRGQADAGSQQIIEEYQPAGFSAKGTVTDQGKTGLWIAMEAEVIGHGAWPAILGELRCSVLPWSQWDSIPCLSEHAGCPFIAGQT